MRRDYAGKVDAVEVRNGAQVAQSECVVNRELGDHGIILHVETKPWWIRQDWVSVRHRDVDA